MATMIRPSLRSFLSPLSLSKTLTHHRTHLHRPRLEPLTQTRGFESAARSPFDSNIIRILRNEIEYQSEYAPPHQPVSSFNNFSVEDCPGEQFIRLTGKYGKNEHIKIEATMFDGCISVPKPGDDTDGEDTRLHISLLVDVYKAEGSDALEFACSAWPDCLEIHKVYMLARNGLPPNAYMGRHFRDMDEKLGKALTDYLEERGVSDELCVFLHQYMMNKDRTELIKWLQNVHSFVLQQGSVL